MLNKLHLLYQTQHKFILIVPNMYTKHFGPFSGLQQACQYKSHLKKMVLNFTFVTQLHKKCTTLTDTYSIIGLHFNVWFTIT